MSRATITAMLLAAAALPACASSATEGRSGRGVDQVAPPAVAHDHTRMHPADLRFPEPDFRLPRTERVVLSNGMVLHLMPDRSLPVVDASATFAGGSVFDPEGKEGLATLACYMVRNGGTASMDPATLDEELDFLAGSIGVGGGTESCGASFSFMSGDLDRGIDLFADVLRNPGFDQARFERVRMGFAQSVMAGYSNPGAVLDRAFSRIVHDGHPYGRSPTPASIQSITLEDVKAYHAQWFHPDAFILAVAGDFDRDALVARLEKAFAGWPKATAPLPRKAPEFERKYRGGHWLVPMEGVTQTNLRMGHWGPPTATGDRVRCDVMNLILGGGSFWSRMTKVVRTKEGLAYSVYSQFRRNLQGGHFIAATQTKAETSYRAIGLMKGLIEEIREQPVTEEELSQAKDFIVNSFIRVAENKASLADTYARLEFEGYPADWLDRYIGFVKAMTVAEAQRVAREYLRPEALEVVLVGDPSLLDDPGAAGLGEPTLVPLESLR